MMRKYTFERRHYFFAFAFPPSKHPFSRKIHACFMINDVAFILIFTYTTHALIDKMQNCIEIFMVMNINVGFIKIYNEG